MKNTYSANAITQIMPEKLKYFRKASGLTIKEVGNKLNKTTAAVSLWEKGKALPDINILLQLCELYGVSDFNLFLENEAPQDISTLTKSEQTLIKYWRGTPEAVQKAILTILSMNNKE